MFRTFPKEISSGELTTSHKLHHVLRRASIGFPGGRVVTCAVCAIKCLDSIRFAQTFCFLQVNVSLKRECHLQRCTLMKNAHSLVNL